MSNRNNITRWEVWLAVSIVGGSALWALYKTGVLSAVYAAVTVGAS